MPDNRPFLTRRFTASVNCFGIKFCLTIEARESKEKFQDKEFRSQLCERQHRERERDSALGSQLWLMPAELSVKVMTKFSPKICFWIFFLKPLVIDWFNLQNKQTKEKEFQVLVSWSSLSNLVLWRVRNRIFRWNPHWPQVISKCFRFSFSKFRVSRTSKSYWQKQRLQRNCFSGSQFSLLERRGKEL